MKYLLFGTGDYYKRYKKWFDREEVLALLDNAPDKQGTLIDGIRVLSPDEGVRLNYDRIVILSFYVLEMKSQLAKLGVSADKVYHFYQLHDIINLAEKAKPVHYFGNVREIIDSERQNKVLLLSQDLTLGGPSIALFHAACVLRKHGFAVVYASMLDGPLRERLLDAQIPVVVDENMQVAVMKECRWTERFSMLVCNTVNFHVFLSERRTDIPVIWWLHDSAFFYGGVNREVMQSIDQTNMQVVSVGPVPEDAVRNFLPDLRIGRLLYGVADTFMHELRPCSSERIAFTTIGYIEKRKGQDLLIQAIQKLGKDIHEKAVFYFVGQDSSEMAQKIRIQSEELPGVIITGTVGREEIDRILERTDVLICPSREDPMPTVCAEAMMHGVPCMISDAAGTSEYIQDGVDGFVFKSEDTGHLAEKIQWCIRHKQKLADMGRKARTVYERYFSMEAFEKSLLECICSGMFWS